MRTSATVRLSACLLGVGMAAGLYALPYLVTPRGGTGITYRFASRTPLRAGTAYFLCPHSPGWCQEPHVSR